MNEDELDRRRFIRSVVGVGTAAGAASLLLAGDKNLVPLAQAGSGTGASVQIDEINYGVGVTEVRSTQVGDTALLGHSTTTSTSGVPIGVKGVTESAKGFGVYGVNSNSGGEWSTGPWPTGVEGDALGVSGAAIGVLGWANSPDGIGVDGENSATSGYPTGVYGYSKANSGAGVWGFVSPVASYPGDWPIGVGGTARSSGGPWGPGGGPHPIGIYGEARGFWDVNNGAISGAAAGVWGETTSSDGVGTMGVAWVPDGIASTGYGAGVYGESDWTDGVGVQGDAFGENGIGVLGHSLSPTAVPIVAWPVSGQSSSLQEWLLNDWTPVAVIDKDGKLGIGRSSPIYGVDIVTGTVGPFRGGSSPPGSAPNSMIFENLVGPGNVKNQLTFKGNGANRYSFGNDISGDGSQNFFIWDEVGAEAVLYVDGSRRVGLGTLSPNATAKLHVAGRVRATGYDTGDIRFANDYTLTEDEKDGVAFVNPDGQKIAVLDREGNLRVRGKVTEGL